MKRLQRHLIVYVLIFGLLCLFTFLAFNYKSYIQNKPTSTELKIGYIKVMAELPMYIAEENGFFEQEDLDVELVPLGYKEEMDALIRGDIDIIPATSLTLPFGVEVQSPGEIKIFNLGGIYDNDNEVVEGVLVQEDSEINTINDLVGKNIGVPEGSVDYFVMKTVLEEVGLSPEENNIQIIQMSKEILPQAFIDGSVDAIYLTQPQLTAVKTETNAKFVVVNPRAKYVLNPFWSGSGVVTISFIQNDTNMVLFKKYLKAIDQAIEYMRENPLESKHLLEKYADIDGNLTDEMGNYFKIKSDEEVNINTLQEIADIYKEVGILNNNIDVESMIYTGSE